MFLYIMIFTAHDVFYSPFKFKYMESEFEQLI